MFGFFRRPASRPLSEAIQRALLKDGAAPLPGDSSQLRMVESSGNYSGRKVTFFRVFLPGSAAQQSLDVRRYDDLDRYQGLILRDGHVEGDGTVMLNRPAEIKAAPAAVRMRAGRPVAAPDAPIEDGATTPPTGSPSA
jgi:hypothetical protein